MNVSYSLLLLVFFSLSPFYSMAGEVAVRSDFSESKTVETLNPKSNSAFSTMVSLSEGEEAIEESAADRLFVEPGNPREIIEVHGDKLELSSYEFDTSQKESARFLNRLNPVKAFSQLFQNGKKRLEWEYKDTGPGTIAMRFLTVAVVSGTSIFVFTLKGEVDTLKLVTIGYSIFVSASFTFLENHADYKWYMTERTSVLSEPTARFWNRIVTFFKRAFLKQEVNMKASFVGSDSEIMIRRLYNSLFIDLMIVSGYEIIKNFPDMYSAATVAEIGTKLITGVFISYGFSFTRYYIKKLRDLGRVRQGIVNMYSFTSKSFMAAIYFSIYSDLIDKSILITHVGIPGWLFAAIVHPWTQDYLRGFWGGRSQDLRASVMAARMNLKQVGNDTYKVKFPLGNIGYSELIGKSSFAGLDAKGAAHWRNLGGYEAFIEFDEREFLEKNLTSQQMRTPKFIGDVVSCRDTF